MSDFELIEAVAHVTGEDAYGILADRGAPRDGYSCWRELHGRG